MDTLERARQLNQEAEGLLETLHIAQIFAPYGGFTANGSYFLDLMVYPDIDLYVPTMTIAQVFAAGAELAASPLVDQVTFAKSDDPTLPGGLYLKPRIRRGDWGRPWKMDIWSIDQGLIAAKLAELMRLRGLLTPALRKLILDYKMSILTPEHRTPIYSGYYIYKAVLEEGITDFAAITQYLLEHGIAVPPII